MKNGKKRNWKWFPHYIVFLSVLMLVVVLFVGWMATDAPAVIPFPDDGENIPGPEWLFLLFWQPFWYWAGRLGKYLYIMPTVPILLFIGLVFLPYFHKIPLGKIPGLGGLLAKARNMNSGFKKSFLYAIPALIVVIGFFFASYKSGYQAKILGCDSCHNPAMGHRMAVPPVDVAKYYNVERAMQIGVGKYRAGKITASESISGKSNDSSGEVLGYKDANWQMRHMYEPTFTW